MINFLYGENKNGHKTDGWKFKRNGNINQK